MVAVESPKLSDSAGRHQICPKLGEFCVEGCAGPQRMGVTVNGNRSETLSDALVCPQFFNEEGRLIRKPASPTSAEAILGKEALALMNADD